MPEASRCLRSLGWSHVRRRSLARCVHIALWTRRGRGAVAALDVLQGRRNSLFRYIKAAAAQHVCHGAPRQEDRISSGAILTHALLGGQRRSSGKGRAGSVTLRRPCLLHLWLQKMRKPQALHRAPCPWMGFLQLTHVSWSAVTALLAPCAAGEPDTIPYTGTTTGLAVPCRNLAADPVAEDLAL